MKKLERILWAVVVVAMLMKLASLPLSSFLLIIGTSLLSLLYFWFSWLLFPQPGKNDQVIVMSILGGIALSVGLTGILFKLQLWPMSGLYLLIGMVGLACMVVASFIIRNSRADLTAYTRGSLNRFVPVMVLCVGLYFLPDRSLISYYYKDDPERAAVLLRVDATQDRAEREQLMLQLDSINSMR